MRALLVEGSLCGRWEAPPTSCGLTGRPPALHA
jgi:hypothetical protein